MLMNQDAMGRSTLERLAQNRELVTPEIHKPSDFYRHAWHLKRYAGVDPNRPLLVALSHAINLNHYVWHVDAQHKLAAYLCSSQANADTFAARTQRTAIAIGPYISYLPNIRQKIEQKPTVRTLVAFPLHSTEYIEAKYSVEKFLENIRPWAARFDRVVICLYWKDILHGLHKKFEQLGYEVVTAGHIYDEGFLPRMADIIANATATVSMHHGTNVLYSLLMDRPAWVVPQEFELSYTNESIKQVHQNQIHVEKEVSHHLLDLVSEPSDIISSELCGFVDEITGASLVRSPQQLRNIFQTAERVYAGQAGISELMQAASFSDDDMGQHPEGVSGMSEPTMAGKETAVDANAGESLRRAMTLLQANKPQDALELIQQARQAGKQIQGMELLAALSCLHLGQIDSAREHVRLELTAFPNSEDARLFLEKLTQGEKTEAVPEPVAKEPVKQVDPREVEALVRQASEALRAGDVAKATELSWKAKSLKVPVRGLDVLRAQVFIARKELEAARQALLEELRLFPDHSDAKTILVELDRIVLSKTAKFGDAEFDELLAKIRPYTMLGDKRLFSIYSLAKKACEENIPGNFVECGVAGGGATAILAYVSKKYSRIPRKVFAFDTFDGMPEPSEKDRQINSGIGAEESGWGTGTCAAPIENVRTACREVGAEDLLVAVPGLFDDTLPKTRNQIGSIAFLHADADWYESQLSIFTHLYDALALKALVQVDDYGYWSGSREAIDEFQQGRGLRFTMQDIDGNGVWFQRPDGIAVNPVADSTQFNNVGTFIRR